MTTREGETMARWLGLLLLTGTAMALLAACGSADPPPPTRAPGAFATEQAIRNATATARAEEALAGRPPCLLDATTREASGAISDVLWQAGTRIGQQDGSLALTFYEASIAYGLLEECREVGATPVVSGTPASPVAPPIACPPDPEGMDELRDAPAKGVPIMVRLIMAGVPAEDLELMTIVNSIIWQRIEEIEVACGLRPAASPVASPVSSLVATPAA
jgi:hypothetical protein